MLIQCSDSLRHLRNAYSSPESIGKFTDLLVKFIDPQNIFTDLLVRFTDPLDILFIHSFIHIEHLYSASSRELLRGAPDYSTAKKSSLKVRKNAGDKANVILMSSIGKIN